MFVWETCGGRVFDADVRADKFMPMSGFSDAMSRGLGSPHESAWVSPPNLTLTEFLLARIAEDEAAAREVMADNFGDGPIGTGDDPWPSERAFAERYTVARVLAECEAKRRIVEEHSGITATDIDWSACSVCRDTSPCVTLRALALPYADHPDYREGWKP